MQELLTGKKRLAGFGEGQGYKQTELGVIPEDWDVYKLIDVVEYIHGKAHEQYIVEFGEYVVVNSKFISTEGMVVKYSSECFCRARVGDVLTVLSDLPNGRALAKCYYVENENLAVNQRVCIWRSKSVDPRYLSYLMDRYKQFIDLDDGVSQTHILNKHIESCKIVLPNSIEEQKMVGEIINSMIFEINTLAKKLEKARQLKQGMMQDLLTGKVRLV